MLKPEAERKALYKQDKRNDFYNSITNLYNEFMSDLDPKILKKILTDASAFDELKILNRLSFASVKDKDEFISDHYEETFINDSKDYFELLEDQDETLDNIDDPFINLVKSAVELGDVERKNRKREMGKSIYFLQN